MNSPFTPPAKPINLITEPQLDFLCSLKKQMLPLDGYNENDIATFMYAFEFQARSMSRAEASAEIDATKAEIAKLKARNVTVQNNVEEGIDGFWEMPDGRIVKVQIAVHGSGNPYAKLLDTETGSFDYSPGLIGEVRRSGTRLPIERAKELGKLYGRCICCGRTLTDEYSIENGIGPICAQKF